MRHVMPLVVVGLLTLGATTLWAAPPVLAERSSSSASQGRTRGGWRARLSRAARRLRQRLRLHRPRQAKPNKPDKANKANKANKATTTIELSKVVSPKAKKGEPQHEVVVVTQTKPGKNGGKPEQTAQLVLVDRQEVGELSAASLLLASGTRLLPIAGSLTGVGSVVLGLHSGYRLVHARSNSQRAEAAHGVAWSLQGLAALGKLVAPHTPGWQTAAKTIGLAGGAIQVGLGSYRLITGAKRRDRRRMILGGLDVGAGLCWAASACAIATPVTLAGFAGFTLAHIAYEHRDALAKAARRLFGKRDKRDQRDKRDGVEVNVREVQLDPAREQAGRRIKTLTPAMVDVAPLSGAQLQVATP